MKTSLNALVTLNKLRTTSNEIRIGSFNNGDSLRKNQQVKWQI